MIKHIAAGLALAASLAAPAAAQGVKEISFGILSTESNQNLKQDWQPLLADMEKRTGLKVNAFFAPDYAGIVEAMRFNKVQVAWMGNKSGIEAVDRAGGEVFAQVVNADGSIGYHSLVSVHKDSPHKSMEDVLRHAKSLNFGIGDPNSTSGFLVPSYYLFARNKLDPKTTFKNIRGANHEANILAVANRQLDAAVHSSDVLERVEKRSPEIAAQLRVVWKSPLIAGDPLLWRKDLDTDARQRVRAFFLGYGKGADTARELAILNKLTLGGFRDSGDAQLLPTRQLELFKEKMKLEADTGLNAQDKAARLDAISRKLAEFQRAS
ncbi:MAG TPA: phosphonate ABC transporter substrate-binding protein [Ramlibacter sp.]|nr:phosphonate ABC transporter substrate-binding protein [Ramlibacter sp.]